MNFKVAGLAMVLSALGSACGEREEERPVGSEKIERSVAPTISDSQPSTTQPSQTTSPANGEQSTTGPSEQPQQQPERHPMDSSPGTLVIFSSHD